MKLYLSHFRDLSSPCQSESTQCREVRYPKNRKTELLKRGKDIIKAHIWQTIFKNNLAGSYKPWEQDFKFSAALDETTAVEASLLRAAFVFQALPPTGEETTSRVALGRKSALTFLAAPRPTHSSEPTPLGVRARGCALGGGRYSEGYSKIPT